MTLEARKIAIIQQILAIENEQRLKLVEDFIMLVKIKDDDEFKQKRKVFLEYIETNSIRVKAIELLNREERNER